MGKIIISPEDNVAVNTETGFKIAVKDIKKDKKIIKYGFPIGHATRDIIAGETVHTDNMATDLSGCIEYKYSPTVFPQIRPIEVFFEGYKRFDGSVGIRNDIIVIPLVGCINPVAQKIAAKYGITAYTHPYGCSQLGDDHKTTQKILAGLIKNPNNAGVLVLGLGCENNTMESFKAVLGEHDKTRTEFLICQQCDDEITEAGKLIDKLRKRAEADRREKFPVSKLRVGLKCGGSDGYSGISANPLVGSFSDMLVYSGGCSVMTEVPEMFGAEQLLMDRAKNKEVFDKTVRLINNFKQYFESHGQVIYENPSPGNKAGGISTLEEKSLGCTQKSGSAPVSGVLDYGEKPEGGGLYLLNGPGNDMVAVTNLAAAGCQLILFTTGRGTPLGGPVPTVKISSNKELFTKKKHWIDFDASPLIYGAEREALAKDLFDYVLRVASGEKTRNEINGFSDIAIFKDGVTL